MKKIFALLLATVMCLSLVACGGSETLNTDENTDAANTDTANTNTTDTELIKEWEEILFNNVWYGKYHDGVGDTEFEYVFYQDGSYVCKNYITNLEENDTWEFVGFYEDGTEYMKKQPIWQTTPNYAFENGLYVANDFTLGITEDGEYVLRTWYDVICYTYNQEN